MACSDRRCPAGFTEEADIRVSPGFAGRTAPRPGAVEALTGVRLPAPPGGRRALLRPPQREQGCEACPPVPAALCLAQRQTRCWLSKPGRSNKREFTLLAAEEVMSRETVETVGAWGARLTRLSPL